MANMDRQGTHSPKMGVDSSAENNPNAPKFICLICLPKPKVLNIIEKRLHRATVVRGTGPGLLVNIGSKLNCSLTFWVIKSLLNPKQLMRLVK